MPTTPTSGRAGRAVYVITGMTCDHCVASVTREVRAIDGVREVLVDLTTGSLNVSFDQPVSSDAIAAAVRDAGYSLA